MLVKTSLKEKMSSSTPYTRWLISETTKWKLQFDYHMLDNIWTIRYTASTWVHHNHCYQSSLSRLTQASFILYSPQNLLFKLKSCDCDWILWSYKVQVLATLKRLVLILIDAFYKVASLRYCLGNLISPLAYPVRLITFKIGIWCNG